MKSEAEPRYLRTPEAARYLGLSPRTLEHLRRVGGGPTFLRVTRKSVTYLIEDLDQWAQRRRQRSTSDAAAGARA